MYSTAPPPTPTTRIATALIASLGTRETPSPVHHHLDRRAVFPMVFPFENTRASERDSRTVFEFLCSLDCRAAATGGCWDHHHHSHRPADQPTTLARMDMAPCPLGRPRRSQLAAFGGFRHQLRAETLTPATVRRSRRASRP